MTSGEFSARRFDVPSGPSGATHAGGAGLAERPRARRGAEALDEAIERTKQNLLARQADEGYFVAELEGDTILESEYILLLAFLGQGDSQRAKEAAAYMLSKQNPDGGWSAYPGGPTEISGAAKAYLALKITGHSPDAEYMRRARQAIVAAGGVESVNSFTRYYFAMLGLIPYDLCPAVPPEMILLPKWSPINLYEMSAWSRTIVVPLSLLWAYRPCTKLPEHCGIDELFANPEKGFSARIGGVNHETRTKGWVDWSEVFHRIDLAIKGCERLGLKPLRPRAIKLCEQWILDRLDKSDGLGAIFPPIVWTLIGLKSHGYPDDHPVIKQQFDELEKLVIRENGQVRLQPCLSPVWDTAIATIALRDAGVPASDPAIKASVDWLLSKEVKQPGDWSKSHPDVEPGGWYFEFNNEFYPDVDDTSMVLIALSKCLPSHCLPAWKTEWEQARQPGSDLRAIVAGSAHDAACAVRAVESSVPILQAMRRGLLWLQCMQSRDGGWGAFDSDNTRELLTKVPFADHNAMIDPSTADISARVLESYAAVGVPMRHPSVERALEFIWNDQCADFAWFGRWGVNYIYGTWQVIVGLVAIGVPPQDKRLKRAAEWLKSKQQPCGGWGETVGTYDDPTLRGTGSPTASQTAWALLGLIAAGEADGPAAQRGVAFLLERQRPDGTWEEQEFTGTGFPRVFYLRYHMYPLYFPLMALARYRAACGAWQG